MVQGQVGLWNEQLVLFVVVVCVRVVAEFHHYVLAARELLLAHQSDSETLDQILDRNLFKSLVVFGFSFDGLSGSFNFIEFSLECFEVLLHFVDVEILWVAVEDLLNLLDGRARLVVLILVDKLVRILNQPLYTHVFEFAVIVTGGEGDSDRTTVFCLFTSDFHGERNLIQRVFV